MATKARQQYFADEISLQKQRREFSLEDNIKQKIDSVEAGAQVNTIETVKVNGAALTPDANKAVNVEVPDVIDNLYSTSTDDALSAKQGKVLYDYLQNIASRGRFLSNWNCATGLPVTNPTTSPYAYMAGDYYSISNVATGGGTNYRPDGSSYTIGQASTTVETEEVNVSDFYLYDGTNWLLLVNTARQIAVDSSLSTTSTNPVENRVVTNAINAKVGVSADSGNDLLDGAKLRIGSESDFSSIVSPDSNTMYIQYVTSSPSPTPGRQPGANTIVYFPLEDDLDDYTGNYTLTDNNGAIINTVDGVKCLDLSASNSYAECDISTLPQGGQIRTNMVWVRYNSIGQQPAYQYGRGDSYEGDIVFKNNGISWSNYGGGLDSGITPNIGDWVHIAVTVNGSTEQKIYINGELKGTATMTVNTYATLLFLGYCSWDGTCLDGYLSKFIVEDKVRTAQEISDYFNQTKGDYGIS